MGRILNREPLDFEKLKYLYENNVKWKDIVKEMGYSDVFCKSMLRQHGIPNRRKVSNDVLSKEGDVIELYKNGIGIKKIAKDLKLSINTVSGILKSQNIRLRSLSEQRLIENHFDLTFFDKIDTEEKAYILGLFYSDGYVSKRGECGFELNIRDIDILQKVKESIGGDFDITIRKRPYKDGEVEMCQYRIYSGYVCEQLIKLGVFENKSLILQFPSDDIVPDNLKRHFIRGYFDGDGSISLYTDGKQIKTLYCGCVTFISSLNDYLCSQNIVNKSSLNFGKDKERRIFCDIQWSGFKNMKSLFHYMYDDAHIYGNRKHNKFLKIFKIKGEDICTL